MKRKVINQAIADMIIKQGNCISEEKLIALCESKISETEKKEIVEHFKTCRRCTKIWAEYSKFSHAEPSESADDFKKDIYKKIIPQKESVILSFPGKHYYAAAAIVMLAVTITTLFYSHYEINKMRDALKKNNAIALSNQVSKEKGKMPIAGVPYYDLYAEDVYTRGAKEIKPPLIYFDETKPLLLILNLTKPVTNPCVAKILDSHGKVVWKLKIPEAAESIISILVSSHSLPPGIYTIVLEDDASQKQIEQYRFQLNQ